MNKYKVAILFFLVAIVLGVIGFDKASVVWSLTGISIVAFWK